MASLTSFVVFSHWLYYLFSPNGKAKAIGHFCQKSHIYEIIMIVLRRIKYSSDS